MLPLHTTFLRLWAYWCFYRIMPSIINLNLAVQRWPNQTILRSRTGLHWNRAASFQNIPAHLIETCMYAISQSMNKRWHNEHCALRAMTQILVHPFSWRINPSMPNEVTKRSDIIVIIHVSWTKVSFVHLQMRNSTLMQLTSGEVCARTVTIIRPIEDLTSELLLRIHSQVGECAASPKPFCIKWSSQLTLDAAWRCHIVKTARIQ